MLKTKLLKAILQKQHYLQSCALLLFPISQKNHFLNTISVKSFYCISSNIVKYKFLCNEIYYFSTKEMEKRDIYYLTLAAGKYFKAEDSSALKCLSARCKTICFPASFVPTAMTTKAGDTVGDDCAATSSSTFTSKNVPPGVQFTYQLLGTQTSLSTTGLS